MLTMSSCLQDYVIENANFFNDFDRTNFVNNAAIALNKDSSKLSLSIKGNHYSNILEKTISHINDIEINSYAVAEFVTKILGSGRVEAAKLTMKDITKIDNIIMKPQYLTEAVLNYKEVINGIASGKYDTDKIKNIYANMHVYVDTLKKRVVSSPININITPKEMLDHSISERVDVTTSYLEDIVLTFLQDFIKNKRELTNEISAINTSVANTVEDLRKTVENVNAGIGLDKIDDTKKKLMLNYTYNMVRAIFEAVSFITYAAIRKVHQFEESVIECQNIYNILTLTFSDAMNIIESGLFDSRSISADDAYNIAEKLITGQNDIFSELANNILQYHKGYISTNASIASDVSGGDVEDYVTTMISNNMYDTDLYKDIVKVYIEISNGLDIIAKNYDDRLLIFDDIIKKAGFSLSLVDRFHNNIEAIDDLNMYGITNLEIGNNGEKERIYFMILSEISDYPRLTQAIANASKEVIIRAEYIENLFEDKSNTELAYSETMTELRTFLNSFKDQFRTLNIQIVKGLYSRLKELANKADQCIDNVIPSDEDNYNESDFTKEAVLASLDEIDEINDIVMETLLREYYSEREFKERGVRLVYEDVEIIDNSGDANSSTGGKISSGKIGNIIKSITSWFDKTIESFDRVTGLAAPKNTKLLANKKDGLLNRSYANIQIKLPPYDKFASTQITADIGKMITNVNAMTVQNLQSINTYEDLRAKLINFGPKFTNDGDEKTILTNYYKVGNNPIDPVEYSNNEIKALLTNTIIPYCDSYYTTYQPDVKKQLDNLKEASKKVQKTYVTESLTEIDRLCSVFMEADAQPAQPQQNQPSAQPAQPTQQKPVETVQQNTEKTTTNKSDESGAVSLSTKAGWMSKCIKIYAGCVMTAINDRASDYFNVIKKLPVKKEKTVTATDTSANTETPTPEATPAQNEK